MQTVPRMVHTLGKKMGVWDWLTHRSVGEEHNILSWGGNWGHPWKGEAVPLQWCPAGNTTQALERHCGGEGVTMLTKTAEFTGLS